MKTISVAVLESDYETFRRSARALGRSTAQLIREAMAFYRQERLQARARLTALPVLAGHRPTGDLPGREELYDEIFSRDESSVP